MIANFPVFTSNFLQLFYGWGLFFLQAHQRPAQQNLFAIIQGGLEENLRAQCCAAMIERDLPGYAIGGLSGGEAKDKFWRVVAQCCRLLPADKPIYCMGVG